MRNNVLNWVQYLSYFELRLPVYIGLLYGYFYRKCQWKSISARGEGEKWEEEV